MHSKEIKVRTPRNSHRRMIVVPGTHGTTKGFTIKRLNHYDPKMKMYKGSVSLGSNLESINEHANSDDCEDDCTKKKLVVRNESD